MSRSRTFRLKESELDQLEDVTQALSCLEHLLVTQDASCYGDLNPQHLAALLDILTNSLGQVADSCRHRASKPQCKTRRANHA